MRATVTVFSLTTTQSKQEHSQRSDSR